MTISDEVGALQAVLDIPTWVSATCEKQPDAIALRHGGTGLTFRDLEVASNRLAHALAARGVAGQHVVGLRMARSPRFVVAALAVMKAGAAYLPIDPEQPADRASFMLANAGAMLLLADEDAAQKDVGGLPVLALDDEFSLASGYADTRPVVALSPDSLAYVIYTSGSSGQPKGVELTHGGLANLVAWHIRTFGLTADDRTTQTASPGFDAAVWEIWPSLCAGATLLFPDTLTRMLPERLRDWLVEARVTVSFVPPVIAEQLMALPWAEDTSLRLLLTGADSLRRYPAAGLPFQVVNNYGPTEGTVVATSGVVPCDPNVASAPTIGKPIDGVDVFILDEFLQPVVPGAAGELCIGGAGLARGYRNNAELTARQFVWTSIAGAPPVRLYRTGDLGRELPNGEIEFLGRADEQIKVRGYRIEPQEISLALNRHPNVKASAVIAVDNCRQDKQLVAYVVTANELDTSSLADFLTGVLPVYMIPTAFVRLSELPLTANGKVDRAKLPRPADAAAGAEAPRNGFIGPRSEVEKRVERVVAQLLGLERVSVRDNLFQLGGHSLFGAQVIARVRDNFGVELPLRKVFEQPTVELLSRQIELAVLARIRATKAAAAVGD
jgi:amino acid adenylation domain-containing protein